MSRQCYYLLAYHWILVNISSSNSNKLVIRTGYITGTVGKGKNTIYTINYGYTYHDYPIVMQCRGYSNYASMEECINTINKSYFTSAAGNSSEASAREYGIYWMSIGC